MDVSRDLFLSEFLLMRLKSPTISQSESMGMSMLRNQSKNSNFPSAVQGAYTFVRNHGMPDRVEVNSTLNAKLF
jgi:hypothetical protein